MSSHIPERDWKRFRELRTHALERFCERVLTEIQQISSDQTRSTHQRYLDIYRLVQRRDRALAEMFNDSRRSTAVFQLAMIYRDRLISDNELSHFSDEVQDFVRGKPMRSASA